MKSAIYMDGNRFGETQFKTEEEFEKIVKENSKTLFGAKTIYFDIKNRIDSKYLGSTIPDGFLFDFKDKENPEFYLVEVELEKHPFDNHIFPQIKKFFAFFKNPKSRDELIGKLFNFIKSNPKLEIEFKKYLGEKEIYKTLKDVIESSQNILLIIDENKPEFEETSDTITEWARLVKTEILKQYTANGKVIFALNPDFENIDIVEPLAHEESEEKYTENFHIEGINENTQSLYRKIKEEILKIDSNIRINPQKYYISLKDKKNFAYLYLKKKKIKIVIMLPYEIGQKMIKTHKLREFTEGVQRFYGSPSFGMTVENQNDIDEVVKLLEAAYKQQDT